ncbi:MAG: response regulator [Nitrospirota bacterium]|nr:response regulator [Nitrospirota bacterium]MDH5698919.1 response regulator [Nitrospirota bacterium]
MGRVPGRPILLVENSPEDLEITVRSLRMAGLNNPIVHCTDGDDALDYLYRRGAYCEHDASWVPGIIFLDLNMPGTDGREVLEELKKDPDLKVIPIVVLTTSADERDVHDCYARGANSYIQKPLDFEKFIQAMARVRDYWFEVVIIPEQMERAQ